VLWYIAYNNRCLTIYFKAYTSYSPWWRSLVSIYQSKLSSLGATYIIILVLRPTCLIFIRLCHIMTMSTYFLKLCLIWLCLFYIHISIFSLCYFKFIFLQFNLEIFLTTNKNTSFLTSRELFSLFVLRLVSHFSTIAALRTQQLLCFFFVFFAVCSSM
jgi:hypothetical protein